MAIGDSSGKKLKLCQIYDWIKDRFPYYRVSPQWSLHLSHSQTTRYFRVRTARAGRTPSDTISHSMSASSRSPARAGLRERETTGCWVKLVKLLKSELIPIVTLDEIHVTLYLIILTDIL